MQTKTYFASSVPAALEVARKELGEDALLVSSKPASAAGKAFGRLEVTFAYESQDGVAALATAQEPVRRPMSELEEIRMQISELTNVARRAGSGFAEMRTGSELRLCAEGFDEDLAREIAGAARTADRGGLASELASRIEKASFQDLNPGESRRLAFIGPPGRGKTSTLVKVAMRYGISQRIPVRIYLAGAHGVGCQEQMARYATILGVPFQACESLESLHLALNGDASKGLILIDTPGISPGDRGELTELGRFFSRRPEIETHLVLRADARSADMSHMVAKFKPAGPSRLLFTGTDEATGLGAMLSTLIKTGLPSVFAGTGQQIPDDLEEVNVQKLARSVCGESTLAAVA